MQIIVNFKIEGICIRQSLSDLIKYTLLSCFLVSFTDGLTYLGIQMKLIKCIKLFQKIGKNTRSLLDLLTSIYLYCISLTAVEPYTMTLCTGYNWASTRENLSSGVCEQHRRRPACAFAQTDQRLCY